MVLVPDRHSLRQKRGQRFISRLLEVHRQGTMRKTRIDFGIDTAHGCIRDSASGEALSNGLILVYDPRCFGHQIRRERERERNYTR